MQVRQLNGLSGGLSATPCGTSQTFVMQANNTIASPCSEEFLGKFQALQRAINAYVRKFGILDTISVDGDIGPNTVRAAIGVWEHGLLVAGISGWPAKKPDAANFLADASSNYAEAFARGAGSSVDRTVNVADRRRFVVGEGSVVPLGPGAKKSGMGGTFLIAAAAGWVAFKITGKNTKRKRRRK